jgi:CO/xanthine dehydrogenase Mo-binding subunit
MGALEDLAAKIGMDPLDFVLKNIEMTGVRANVYRDELLKAAEMIEWKKLWRPARRRGGRQHRDHQARTWALAPHLGRRRPRQ